MSNPNPLHMVVSVASRPASFQSATMSSPLFSSLPSFNGLSSLRIQSLYSDISRLKHSNPTTYNSNLAWWHSALETVVSRGSLPNTSDRFILHADQTLLDTLRYEGVGKPLCLGTVIVSCNRMHDRDLMPTIIPASED